MKKVYFLICLLAITFTSCKDKYEQEYANFEEYQAANQRNKTWFPDILNPDAFDIKNQSRLDSLTAFGVFSYKTDSLYDALFADSTKAIAFGVYCDKTQEILKDRPVWFEDPKVHVYDGWKAIQLDSFYITRDNKNKKIYFILNK